MAWEHTEWACGHTGSMQLYGKQSGRDSTVAVESGRKCMACWLVQQWEQKGDPRAKREDRYKLAADIAERKGKRINVPDSVPVKTDASTPAHPLADVPLADLLAEIDRRKSLTA